MRDRDGLLKSLRAALCGALLLTAAPAQELSGESQGQGTGGDWEATSFTTRQGLPLNWVTCIVQTRDGYIWLGTHDGLARFDGRRFRVFDMLSTPALPSNRIGALYESSRGDLWIGTLLDGVVRLREGEFTTFSEHPAAPRGALEAISEDRHGNVWFAGEDLVRYSAGSFAPAELDPSLPPGVRHQMLHRDPAGSLWSASSAGVLRLADEHWEPIEASAELRDPLFLGESPLGTWVAGSDWFAYLRDSRLVPASLAAPLPGAIGAALLDRNGVAWVGVGRRIFRLGEQRLADGGLEVALLEDASGPAGRDDTARAGVRALLEDREGNLWAGLDGLIRYRQRPVTTIALPTDDRALGLEDVQHSGLAGSWLAVEAGPREAYLLIYADGEWQRYQPEKPRSAISAMFASEHGGVWIASPDNRLSRLTDGPSEEFEHDLGRVLCLAEDARGVPWMITPTALASLEDGVFVEHSVGDAPSWPMDGPVVMRWSRDGELLAAWPGAILRRDTAGATTYATSARGLPLVDPRSMHLSADGAVWISTYGGGLLRWFEGRFTSITNRDGLPDDALGAILEDGDRNLWINSNHGIFRVHLEDLKLFAEGRRDEVPVRLVTRSEGDGAAGGRLPDGRLWFRTVLSLVVIDPDAIEVGRLPPKLAIESVRADGEEVDHRQAIRVPPGKGHLEIDFAVLSFASPERVRARYMLEGYDSGWVDAQDLWTARYTSVPPGRYTFRLAARNDDGHWEDAATALEFELVPAFWQTGWFVGLVTLLLLGGALLAHARRTHRIRASNAALRAEVDSRVRAEVAHNEQKERLQVALSSAKMGTWRWDPVADLSTLDASMSRLLGFPEQELTMPTAEYIARFHPEDRDRACLIFDRAVADHVDMVREFRMVRPDGQTCWYRERGRPHYAPDGTLAYVTGASVDITRRKQADAEHRQLEEGLRQRHKMEAIGQLASGVAHEFNNLLVGILCNAEMLLEGKDANLDAVARKRVQHVNHCGERAAALTHKLLSFAKRDTTRKTRFDLNEVIRESAPMLDGIVGQGIELQVELAEDLPLVTSDRGQIDQGLLNLILNARDAVTGAGRVTIRTEAVTIGDTAGNSHLNLEPGKYALFSVSDDGCGMNPQVQARIFEPFFSTKPTGQGTGLGLSTLFADVTNAGGHVEVESREGEGATFRVFLRASSMAVQTPYPSPAVGGQRGFTTEGTILICDDEQTVLSAVASVLQEQGYFVLEARGPEEARTLSEDHETGIDLLIVDVLMQDVSGPELAQELVADRPEMRVMYMSGYPADVLRVEGQEFEFITKPPTRVDLLRRVREVLGRAHSA